MKFIINGKFYDPVLGLQKVTLQTLFVLKVKHGISVGDLQRMASRIDEIKDPLAIMDDPAAFQVLMVIVWLARKYAGENLTLEEANDDFGLADMTIVNEDTDEAAPDPKAPTRADSVQAAKRRKAKARRSGSKT